MGSTAKCGHELNPYIAEAVDAWSMETVMTKGYKRHPSHAVNVC